MTRSALLFPLLALVGCLPPAPSNIVPMYGGVPKHEEYQKLDQAFIEATMKEFKTRDEAASYYASRGWEFLKEKGDWQTAMKRFN